MSFSHIKNKVLIHAKTWMNLVSIILSESSQKFTSCVISFIQNIHNRQIHRAKKID